MAYENIEASNSNFCLTARTDEFGCVDHSAGVFRIKSSAGANPINYSLDTSVGEIKSIEYVGPRNLVLAYSQLGNVLPFFTLERNSSSSCSVKKWHLNSSNGSLDLGYELNFTSTGSYYFDCYSMAVSSYQTTFDQPTTTGTGKIKVSSVGAIAPGDILLLGPSTDVDNMHAFEEVVVDSIDVDWVFVSTSVSGSIAPIYEYQGTDKITYCREMYLFSDIGQGNNTSVGSLYKIHSVSGTILEVQDSAIYNGVRAASWSRDYNSPGFVQYNNILYLNLSNYEVLRSQVMTNVESDNTTLIPVYGIIFDNTDIYRLQRKTTLSNDSGVKTTPSWTYYNYQLDNISPYTKTVGIGVHPSGVILNDKIVTLKAIVRDQFGVGLVSRNVKFYEASGSGAFTPLNGEAVTDANGIASVIYETNYYDPTWAQPDNLSLIITVRSDGSSAASFGSAYAWDAFILDFHKRFRIEPTLLRQISNSVQIVSDLISQIISKVSNKDLKCLSKFQFPGGDWTATGAPSSDARVITQIKSLTADGYANQIPGDFDIDTNVVQDKDKSNSMQMSQLYTSRHSLTDYKDTATLNQFIFIQDAVPAFWSEKNSVDTSIWIRMRPFAFSLNQSTLVFKVRQISHLGDTGYIDVTSSCSISTFDAGGGLLGLDVTYQHPVYYNHNAVIYVSIEVYDIAPSPNIIVTDYWFKIIPDYRAPYITNEIPNREEEDVSVDTTIEFDVFDAGMGVDISTLIMYVNNRYVTPVTSVITGGYNVVYTPAIDFFYGETVEVFIYIRDIANNLLYDAWRFYCVGSSGPWIDRNSFVPGLCKRGVYRKITGISANVYGIEGAGVDPDSIIVHIGGKKRDVVITPIIYRID